MVLKQVSQLFLTCIVATITREMLVKATFIKGRELVNLLAGLFSCNISLTSLILSTIVIAISLPRRRS